ncbi:MAG: DHA2 family efflux MFS transporter permease subunit [Candidatus Paracaedibacteraceae bacterium]|nr:DHA2 family efflux MFS transporter permease subunit [Candidatus Paracaedibacteraceae bacterium]
MTARSAIHAPVPVLAGNDLILAAVVLAVANFLVVLDSTIANVSIPHIAGGLAVSSTEGTYVITSYAVAEAITVPLTGWLAKRFGTLRVFTTCIALFGFFSCLCGLANSLGTLILGRVFQGLAGGPLMPLSQTLLMQIFPKEKQGAAIGLWSMTTLLAPVLGPILGGGICDNWGWEYIFFINIPIAAVCSVTALRLLRPFETKILKEKMDFIGLLLLITWVSSLQLMLDEGKNYDWFESKYIWGLGITAAIGFAAFIIWELTHEKPIVNLRVFRHRGYAVSVLTISLAFGAFFGSVVLTPLWLQMYMGYTASWSGFSTAAIGIFSMLASPIVAKFTQKYDLRILVFSGVMWLGLLTFVRSFNTTDMTYLQIALPMLIQGFGIPFFFIPLTRLALVSVTPDETASAAGLMSFMRTLSGAAATSIVTTSWEDKTNVFRTDLVARSLSPEQISVLIGDSSAYGQGIAAQILEQMTQSQAVMLATNQIFLIVAFTFSFAALAICFAPKPGKASSLDESTPSH